MFGDRTAGKTGAKRVARGLAPALWLPVNRRDLLESSGAFRVRLALGALLVLGAGGAPAGAQEISRSWELRYFTSNPAADGETDFKGKTSVFDTEQRVQFLERYAEYAKRFWNDPRLDSRVVDDAEVGAALRSLKPQPLPEVRTRIPLRSWKWTGHREGLPAERARALAAWKSVPGAEVRGGTLRVTGAGAPLVWRFPSQGWRLFVQWRAKAPVAGRSASFTLSDRGRVSAATVGFGEDGRLFYRTADGERRQGGGRYRPGAWHRFRIELDFAQPERTDPPRYNLYVDDRLVADWVPVERTRTGGVGYAHTFGSIGQVNTFAVRGAPGVEMDDLWGVGYHATGRESYPYTVETFLDEDFQAKPEIAGWSTPAYDDALWRTGELPIVHGTERHAGEDLYLRTEVNVGRFGHAFLDVEALDPGGEIWINGRRAAVLPNRRPARIDVSRYLRPNAPNLIAIRVDPFYLTAEVGEIMPHSSLDFNVGWSAGRMSLDLTGPSTLEDVFVYTDSLGDGGAPAVLRARLEVANRAAVPFRGRAVLRVFPWFPAEAAEPVAVAAVPIAVEGSTRRFEAMVRVPDPRLWTPESPHLYRVQVVLEDERGRAVDDYVLTTGIRTLGQQGGTFRLNGKPALLKGAQTMGFRAPIEKSVLWLRSAPPEWLARELLMVKKANGNMMRVHVHGWEFSKGGEGINDPRIPEMADQLGVLLVWPTTAWIRTGQDWRETDLTAYPRYMRQVRNHPSIAMWEAANHPQTFKRHDVSESNRFVDSVYTTIHPHDPSRLISATSFVRHLHYGNDAGTVDQEGKPITPTPNWTAPMITRGNQDAPTGYGEEWTVLREWPDAYRRSFLDSPERAYFNFEHEESASQANWNLTRGKPYHRMPSYEWSYDEGSIGRRLSVDEWEASQAWQAFSAWEATKKQRLLDYDGFSWIELHGGPNSGTYMKPMIDMGGHAKLAFYANRMIYQDVVAGSADVDVVYGPRDAVEPVVMNVGDARRVDVLVSVRDVAGREVDNRRYQGVVLPSGRSQTALPAFRPRVPGEGPYAIEYTVVSASK